MIFRRTFGLPILFVALSTSAMAQIGLANATATFSQNFSGVWNASEMIDGDFGVNNGWAIFRGGADPTQAETAVMETVSDFTAPGFSIVMHQIHGNPGHLLGRFRWSVTTDDRSLFADGLQNGGDVTANWTVVTPTAITVPGNMNAQILGDGSVLVNGTNLTTALYTVQFNQAVSGVTGFRLETLLDPSLPTGGPGLFPTNGNFVVNEVQITAVPEPATLLALGLGAAGVLARKRRK